MPAGNSDGGQWTDEGGGAAPYTVAQSRGGRSSTTVRIGGRDFEGTPAQVMRLSNATNAANRALAKVREVNPSWSPSPSIFETIEGAIAAREAEARQAEKYYRELYRDAIPNTNPSWGVNRLRKELYRQGYSLKGAARSDGFIYRNAFGAEIRILNRPLKRYRTDPPQKFWNEFYYRFRPGKDQGWGDHIPIPDKNAGS